jgi:tripartite-type tricarboxylate transporter receptor subunit TctC
MRHEIQHEPSYRGNTLEISFSHTGRWDDKQYNEEDVMKSEGCRTKSWKSFIIAVQLGILLAVPSFAAEDATKYPSKPITMILPFGPGGTSDLLGRRVADLAGKILGRPIVCENKPGGGGVIAVNALKNSAPDGYTLGLVTPSAYVATPLIRSVPYDVLKDFAWIMQFCEVCHLFGVLPESRWKTIQDYMEEARKNPGKLTYSTSAAKGLLHIFMEQVAATAKVQITHVPTNSGAEVITSLLGGHINAGLVSDLFTPMNAGKVRGLAVVSQKRLQAIPEVPTFYELYKLELPTWFGVNAPAAVDPKILLKLEDALRKAADDAEFKKFLTTMHLAPLIRDAESFRQKVHKDYEAQGKIMKDFGMAK